MMTSADFVSLLNAPAKCTIAVVACSKSKQVGFAPARDLYTSPLFKKSLQVAKALSPAVYILSAKYGLVSESTVIESYDQRLDKLTKDQIQDWTMLVSRQIESLNLDPGVAYVFAGSSYVRHFSVADEGRHQLVDVLHGQSLGKRLQQLSAYTDILDRRQALSALYSALENKYAAGRVTTFGEFANLSFPRKGIYIFLDPSEPTSFSNIVPRIVRIGTHGVSLGSSSTLRTRLRAHFGLNSGAGNHRSSIFRLHVGSALLAQAWHKQSQTWGKGQSANRQVRDGEIELEQAVSNYLRQLLVLTVEIDDPSSSKSLRAQVERALIGILAGNGGTIDPPSASWLGNFSKNPTVQKSGLWNVQHVGYHPTQAEIAMAVRVVSAEGGSLM